MEVFCQHVMDEEKCHVYMVIDFMPTMFQPSKTPLKM